ncbi:1,2-phenylacetyl-CoA epoxidase subunit PaaD [Fulvivirgaceae bacterium BMA10]|uniref:1,2-phenylacetyl-CoA epoxidase subunit PaaD n=1 Tax=Splendidivirga corallicola TaxID=3051826 RepID=A0ABT8KK96_9BACT|nr:1,2-phenylacetyl-CoA epoxidase subunit PaaD [Fulvivirgaceae bacterium BMA10]
MSLTERKIWSWLEEVKDPEIPVLSLVDLGVITKVEIDKDEKVIISMTPTFIGCPALDYMKKDVEDVLAKNGISNYEVNVSLETSWNSNMISEKGRKALKQFGLAPPPKHNLIVDLDVLENVICPNCGSQNTVMKSPFGPTLCRAIHHCENCKETFEQFKPI